MGLSPKGNMDRWTIVTDNYLSCCWQRDNLRAIILELSSYRSVVPVRPSCFCVFETTRVRSWCTFRCHWAGMRVVSRPGSFQCPVELQYKCATKKQNSVHILITNLVIYKFIIKCLWLSCLMINTNEHQMKQNWIDCQLIFRLYNN